MACAAIISVASLPPFHPRRLALPPPVSSPFSSFPAATPPFSSLLKPINPLGAQVLRNQLLRRVLCFHSLTKEPATTPQTEDNTPPQRGRGGGGGGDEGDGLINLFTKAGFFALWASLILYAFIYSPNQTPFMDQYFLKKLVGLKGDDGFLMNQVLVCLWYIMGLWPLIFTMLLIPTGRSSKGRIAVWPFATLSFFVGMFGFLPYFGLWEPPPPSIAREELDRWPMKAFESKIFAAVVAVASTSLAISALLAGGNSWNEFLQYSKGSRFVHITSLDFLGLSLLAPFWVYNDITVRQCSNKISWITLLSLVPFLGPAWYLVFRKPLPTTMFKDKS